MLPSLEGLALQPRVHKCSRRSPSGYLQGTKNEIQSAPSIEDCQNLGQFFHPGIVNGRLDDRGEAGMDLVRNIKKMYEHSDGHVHVLAASIRSVNHLLCSFALGAELATVPTTVLDEWAAKGFPMPDQEFRYQGVDASGKPLKEIPYKGLGLELPWQSFDIAHELTAKGIQKFVADYQSTLRRSA